MRASLIAQVVNHLPAMRETWVQPLGREDLLEEGMATHSSILAKKIPWTEVPLPWWFRSKKSVCNAGDLGAIPGLGRDHE